MISIRSNNPQSAVLTAPLKSEPRELWNCGNFVFKSYYVKIPLVKGGNRRRRRGINIQLRKDNVMRILVDADGCPVRSIIIRLAKQKDIPVIMVTDVNHNIDDGYSTVKIVDQGMDSADFALVGIIEKGDIVVTQDYGVAAMAINKADIVLNQNGMIYDDDNIERLLMERYISKKHRKQGGRTKHKKRTANDNNKFESALIKIINKRN